MNKLRVLLAEDHTLVREGLKLLINSQNDMEVVGEGADGQTCLDEAQTVQPELAVIDVMLPDMRGPLVIQKIMQVAPRVQVLALSVHQSLAYVRQIMEVGARGYALKLSKPCEFLRAIRTVASGGIYVDPFVANKNVRTSVIPEVVENSTARSILTSREIELIELVSRGYSNQEIAMRLGVAVKSEETYKSRIMEKLGFRTRVQLIQFAIEQGWLRESCI